MYLAYEPTRQMWETPVSPPLMGFGQEEVPITRTMSPAETVQMFQSLCSRCSTGDAAACTELGEGRSLCPEPCPVPTAAAPTAAEMYPPPELGLGGQFVASLIGFGIMVLAAYAGTRWALKAGR